jgi:hypothetical protein
MFSFYEAKILIFVFVSRPQFDSSLRLCVTVDSCRSRSGLSAVIFLPWPARRCSILSFGLPLMCSVPKVPGKSSSTSRSPTLSARAWSLQPCFPLWLGSSAPGTGSARLRFSLAADAAVFALTSVAGYKSRPVDFFLLVSAGLSFYRASRLKFLPPRVSASA